MLQNGGSSSKHVTEDSRAGGVFLSELQTHPSVHSPVRVGPQGGPPKREITNVGVGVPIWLEIADLSPLSHY